MNGYDACDLFGLYYSSKKGAKGHLSVSSWLDHSNECENCNSENNLRGRPIFY